MIARTQFRNGKGGGDFYVESVKEMDAFLNLRNEWDEVYRKDHLAAINRSWIWMRGWIGGWEGRWVVLVVRDSKADQAAAFLALALSPKGRLGTVVDLAGEPMSEHTGCVCNPGFVEDVIEALADYICNEKSWSEVRVLECLDPRIDRLLMQLAARGFKLSYKPGTPCPYITLPSTWETYLSGLKKNARANIRRVLREIDVGEDYRVVNTNLDNLDAQLETAFSLREARFERVPEELKRRIRILLRALLEEGILRFNTYWHGGAGCFGAAVSILDREKGLCTGYWKYFKEGFPGIHSPGLGVVAMDIRMAIEEGLVFYDNGRGAEPYKENLGTVKRWNINVVARRVTPSLVLKRGLRYAWVNRARLFSRQRGG